MYVCIYYRVCYSVALAAKSFILLFNILKSVCGMIGLYTGLKAKEERKESSLILKDSRLLERTDV